MSKVDMAQFGLPGFTYHFSGKVRYFKRASDEEKFMCKTDPSQLPFDLLENLGEFVELTTDELAEIIIELTDSLKAVPTKAQRGSERHVEVNWENAVEYDAKGGISGLNCYTIGKLMSEEYIRIDDTILKPVNNIAKLITEESLTRDILGKLNDIHASQYWKTGSYKLIRDHIMSQCPAKKLGATKGFLPVENGVLDLETLELTQTDEVYLTAAKVVYDPDATCPATTQLLYNMFTPEQKEMVLSILGAAISGRSAQFILCLSGSGRNGKSILREMLAYLMGDLFTAEKIQRLHDDFVNQVFLGKRVVWQTEVSSKVDFSDKLKDLSGGTSLTVQYKYKNGGFQAHVQCIVVLDTNHPPHLEQSKAMVERLRFIDMPRTFVYTSTGAPNEILIDMNLAEAWKNETSGFLNLILPYAQHFLKYGKLKYDMGAGLSEYNKKADSLTVFIEEMCDIEEGLSVSTTTFFEHYQKFAERYNVASLPAKQVRWQLQHEYNFMVKGMTIYGIRHRKQQTLEKE